MMMLSVVMLVVFAVLALSRLGGGSRQAENKRADCQYQEEFFHNLGRDLFGAVTE
jgi:hypothetical protein